MSRTRKNFSHVKSSALGRAQNDLNEILYKSNGQLHIQSEEPTVNEKKLQRYQKEIKEATDQFNKSLKIGEFKSYQEYFKKTIIENQDKKYKELVNEFRKYGSEGTRVPELKYVVDYLKCGLMIPIIEQECNNNPYLDNLRDSLILTISSIYINPERQFCYGPTLRVIKLIIEFYDIFIRSLREQTPPHYHKYRYERMFEYCISMASQGLIMIPTFYNLGITDLLQLRPYPLFPVGIVMDLIHVDEFLQTPIEFFIHDINHIRRMFEENLRYMKKNRILRYKHRTNDIEDIPYNLINDNLLYVQSMRYYDSSFQFKQKIMDIINNNLSVCEPGSKNQQPLPPNCILEERPFITKGVTGLKKMAHLQMDDYSQISFDTKIDHGYAHLIKILIFEITHEDALPLMEDVICKTIGRLSGIPTLFPRVVMSPDGKVQTVMRIEYGGSILGFVRYKIRYGFFDANDSPQEGYVRYAYRTDTQIANAVQIALKKICNKGSDFLSLDQILYCITDHTGLNVPVNKDNLKTYIPPDYLTGPNGDLSVEQIRDLRQSLQTDIMERLDKFDELISNPVDKMEFKKYKMDFNAKFLNNNFSGIRPRPVNTNIGKNAQRRQYRKATMKLLNSLK
jgi:hypothetical protein